MYYNVISFLGKIIFVNINKLRFLLSYFELIFWKLISFMTLYILFQKKYNTWILINYLNPMKAKQSKMTELIAYFLRLSSVKIKIISTLI